MIDRICKVGIITFHFPHNVGAVLQCYALQTKLGSMGYYVSVIDYRPEYHMDMYKPIRNPFAAALKHVKAYNRNGAVHGVYMFARHFYSVCKSNLKFRITKQRENVFNAFISKNLRMTSCYHSLAELKESPPQIDIGICGSDQIWNSDITAGGIDGAYYLDFGNEQIKRVSYAASAEIKDYEINEVVKLLKGFDRISVREEDSKAQLQKCFLDVQIEVQVDPTLLLKPSDYCCIESEAIKKDYILIYGLKTKDSQVLRDLIKKVKEHYNYDLIDISPVEWRINADIRKEVISPQEFLSLIHYAKLVVTNSFHGTVFSCIYNTPFWSVIPSLKGSRVSNLAKVLNLSDRIVTESNLEALDLCVMPDFQGANRELELLRMDGERYLNFGK